VAALVMGLVLGAATSLARAQPLELSGSLKSLFLRSRASTGEDYALSLNRLRVEAKGNLAPGLALDLQYDNELLLGNYLDTGEFRAVKDRAPPQYWRADANYLERGDVYGRHRLHRAALMLTRGDVDLKLGRQRIECATHLVHVRNQRPIQRGDQHAAPFLAVLARGILYQSVAFQLAQCLQHGLA
jgi:hypothetical protein